MKITKVFAGLLAMAVAATTAISASAASTITVNNPEPTDWGAAFPKWTDGTQEMDDYIDAKTFTKDAPLEVKVKFEYTQSFTDNGYANLKPCHAAQGWGALYKEGYIENIYVLTENCDYDDSGVGYKTSDNTVVAYCMQTTGDIVTNDPNNTEIAFTITAEGVNAMIAAANSAEGAYDGLQLQESGLNVKSIELSQDGVQLSSQYSGGESKGDVSTDSTAGSDGSGNKPGSTSTDTTKTPTASTTGTTGTSGSTSTNKGTTTSTSTTADKTANTGATAGLALAGLALAGAAFVVSKKK